jgi:type I restriction enzyme S subunit
MTITTQPLKRAAFLNPEVLPENTPQDTDISYIDIGSIGRGVLLEEPAQFTFGEAPSRARRVVRAGDTIVSTVRTYLRAVLAIDQTLDNCVASTGFLVARPDTVDARFLAWALQSTPFVEDVVARSVGVSYPAISPSAMGTISLPTPGMVAQRKIADFLDRETERIDALVDKKRRLIDLLEEKRTATITHSTSVDSSPLVQLGRLVDLTPGYAFASSGFRDEGIRLLRGVNVAPGSIRWGDVEHWALDAPVDASTYSLDVDDVALGMDRPWIGSGMRVAQVKPSDLPSLLVQRVARLRARSGLDQSFLYAALRSLQFKAYFDPIVTGISVPHISGDQILNYRCRVPNIEDQRLIVKSIDRQSAAIDTAIERLEKQAVLLAEYREALITAAVTGEIDVDTFDNDRHREEVSA